MTEHNFTGTIADYGDILEITCSCQSWSWTFPTAPEYAVEAINRWAAHKLLSQTISTVEGRAGDLRETLAALRAQHRPMRPRSWHGPQRCSVCGTSWPCKLVA